MANEPLSNTKLLHTPRGISLSRGGPCQVTTLTDLRIRESEVDPRCVRPAPALYLQAIDTAEGRLDSGKDSSEY